MKYSHPYQAAWAFWSRRRQANQDPAPYHTHTHSHARAQATAAGWGLCLPALPVSPPPPRHSAHKQARARSPRAPTAKRSEGGAWGSRRPGTALASPPLASEQLPPTPRVSPWTEGSSCPLPSQRQNTLPLSLLAVDAPSRRIRSGKARGGSRCKRKVTEGGRKREGARPEAIDGSKRANPSRAPARDPQPQSPGLLAGGAWRGSELLALLPKGREATASQPVLFRAGKAGGKNRSGFQK